MTRVLFPSIVIACQVGAALLYACGADWRRAIFWLAAAAMNAIVTW